MNIHKNAPLTPLGRERMVQMVLGGLTPEATARAVGVSPRTVRKWVARFEADGAVGLQDRSSRPHALRNPTPTDIVERIIALRRERWTGERIAQTVGVSSATVSRVLRRAGLSRMKDLEPAEPDRRYEYAEPGGMIHLDIKRLGRFERVGHRITGDRTGQSSSRGVGWEYVHVCIDDASRIAYTDIFTDEKKESAIAFLEAAVAWYARLGVKIERVMTDNGGCYKSKAFARTCKALGLKHVRTKPYTPRTNGKAERFIQTTLREWAYARAYNTSDHRAEHLPQWTHMYNWHRPHSAVRNKPPISRLKLGRDNLLRLHI